ncbi:hypothetical protein HA402_016175 [Bradysia odoriphaga]|nr:hypothetical protein HA402_016175 [Bradysia odoriphaga]
MGITGQTIVVMGPAACGKSEVASALSQHYQCEYIDADSLHPPSNIEKMSNAIPLTDNDRFPWLKTVRDNLVLAYQRRVKERGESDLTGVQVVVACSSLKKIYRDILSGCYAGFEDDFREKFKTIFVFLNCSESVLAERIGRREGHFMKANMLQSQLNTLEIPDTTELAIIVNGDQNLSSIITDVTEHLNK